jgi:hypothetical protein
MQFTEAGDCEVAACGKRLLARRPDPQLAKSPWRVLMRTSESTVDPPGRFFVTCITAS